MKLTDIKTLTNTRLAGEQLTYSALVPYFDAVIDEINEKMHACFRTFSEVNPTGFGEPSVYEEFPDRYIRTVVCIGAAAKWYVDDEEGIETATALKMQYDNNLFVMVRDYGPLLPDDKKRNDEGGFLRSPYDYQERAINPEYQYIPVEGVPGTSIEALELREVDGEQHLYAKLVSYTAGGGYRWVDCGIIKSVGPKVAVNTALPSDPMLPKNTLGFEIRDK